MRTEAGAILLVLLLTAGPAMAQDAPVADSATPPSVDSTPLDQPNPGAAGLLSPAVTGLPTSLWRRSDPETLTTLIAALDLSVPMLKAQMRALMLAEADPPSGDTDIAHLTGRLDWLVDNGAVEEASALLDLTGVDEPRLFRIRADLGLLLNRSESVCETLGRNPRLSSDLSLRIFCTAREGDWNRAALLLRTADTLGELGDRQAELLTRFLDPELADGDLLPPVRPSPLEFRLFEAIGEPLPTAPLPLPFAVLDLSGDNGWRDQIQAAERLARAGSLPPNRLLGIYSLREPAASGGIWDRVEALQSFESALERGSPDTVGATLRLVWPQMASAGLLVPFSQLFAERLATVEGLDPPAARLAARAAFLSPAYEELSTSVSAGTARPEITFLTAIARGEAPRTGVDLPHAEAVAKGFGTATPPSVLTEQLSQGRLGEVILRAMALFASGAAGNGGDLTDALATLRAVGLEDTARRASLELMLLDAERARR